MWRWILAREGVIVVKKRSDSGDGGIVIPGAARVKSMVLKCLGPDAWGEYWRLRDSYKLQGLTPLEARRRAFVELKVQRRYDDWRRRTTTAELLGRQVPLTPAEVEAIGIPQRRPRPDPRKHTAGHVEMGVPDGVGEILLPPAEQVGNQDMSLAEQVAWAKKWAARVQNGEDAPRSFPSEGALFWFQSAISNRREFEKVVLRVESPAGEGDSAYLADGQYQLKEIRRQLEEALVECGGKMLEVESGFATLLKEAG